MSLVETILKETQEIYNDDLRIGIIYLLRVTNPDIDEEAMQNLAFLKIQKWKDKLNEN